MPNNISSRLGVNLMNGSDFESFTYFNANERSWRFDRKHTVINNYGASGSKSLGVTVNSNQTSEVGLQAFRRKFKGDIPTTVTAKVKTDNTATIRFYWQGRRYDQGFFQARKESEKHLIGAVDLAG
ncbi:hypothetical protein [Thalassotalea sp. ND16A]|uniref:hypothetical protein n=1 Tax=Thalassotalea sp. ND16A TaxID=1535422 RepID=UPI00051CC806|nr:hypothetical protein [Thalassotalea sp. ND16A]KGJ96685.1 hypothetical protein ND16A_1038 [Thalassotalea sp. ND16A]